MNDIYKPRFLIQQYEHKTNFPTLGKVKNKLFYFNIEEHFPNCVTVNSSGSKFCVKKGTMRNTIKCI